MRTLPPIVGLERSGKLASFFRRITRTHLISAGFIFLSLLSVSLLVAVIVQARTRSNANSSVDNTKYCISRGCLSAAAHQLRSMNSTASVDRCTDFYTYACGSWQRTHPIQSFEVERTILGDVIERRDVDIERLLDSPVSRQDPNGWEWKVKTYYTECRDDYARAPDSGKSMIGLIQDRDTIDGWFLLDNSAADASQDFLLKNQTIYQQLSHIQGDLGVNVVFGLRTKFVENDSTGKRLEFFPAGLSMDVNDYLRNDSVSEGRRFALKTYILDVLAFLAQDAGISDGNLNDRMFTIALDVLSIERSLAEILKRSQDTSDTSTSMSLKEMSDRYSLDFVELMSHELGDPSLISGMTHVYVTNSVYFQESFEILSQNNDLNMARMLHNYMRWSLVRTYIEDLSYNYAHAHRTFLDNYLGYALHSSNDAYCTREVIRRFPLAIQRLYTRNAATYTDASQTIQNIFIALKDGFQLYLDQQATWMPDEPTKRIAKQKIEALTAAIGYANIASNDTNLDEYYERFAVDDKSHFGNAFAYHRFRAWTLSNALINPDQLDHWDFFETRTSRLFDYIAIFNRLFVIASAMHEPLVNAEWPWSLNMGSIGVLLAQKLFSIIDSHEGRTHAANGTIIPDWWSPETTNGFNTIRKCITDYYVSDVQSIQYTVNGVQLSVQLAGEPFSPTTLRHIGALRLAYTTLNRTDQLQSLLLPGTNFTSEQTFFLAYAQTQCYQRQELLQILRTQLGSYDEQTALNAALVHMPEFVNAFQCKPKEKQCL